MKIDKNKKEELASVLAETRLSVVSYVAGVAGFILGNLYFLYTLLLVFVVAAQVSSLSLASRAYVIKVFSLIFLIGFCFGVFRYYRPDLYGVSILMPVIVWLILREKLIPYVYRSEGWRHLSTVGKLNKHSGQSKSE